MTNKLNNLSLAAILGLGACAGSRAEVKPYIPFYKGEPSLDVIDPPKKAGNVNGKTYVNSAYVFPSQAVSPRDYIPLVDSNKDLEDSTDAHFKSYINGLPVRIVDDSTSVDLGLARVAASGDSVLLRPIYSRVYEMSLDNDLRLNRYDSRNDSFSSPIYFDTQDSMGVIDDPERIRSEEGIVISSLLKWAWGWDVFSPLRNTANDVRNYSNEVVRSTLGSNSDFDYTGRRVILGYNVPIDRFYLEFNVWADVADIDQSGVAIQMTLPFGTRN